jgi:acyl carrier protein
MGLSKFFYAKNLIFYATKGLNGNNMNLNLRNAEILVSVISVMAEVFNIEEEEVKPESQIINDLGADSLDIISLLMELEDEFGGEIPDEDAEKLVTVQDVVDYIKENTNKRESI